MSTTTYLQWFEEVDNSDVGVVGGKNASLGEMLQQLKQEGIQVPDGFATTAEAYWKFIEANDIQEKLSSALEQLHDGSKTLDQAGKAIRRLFTQSKFPREIDEAIRKAYRQLCDKTGKDEVDVAVRSSATAEDLPESSFAGQQETFLNVTGEEELLDACRKCYASLFTNRAISYREEKGFEHTKVALSIGVQRMVRSDKSGSGVMFTLDTDTGFPDIVVINAAWGLGENVVQGSVTPDEYRVFKPLLDQRDLRPIIGKERGKKEKKMVYAKDGSQSIKNVDTSHTERRAFVLTDDEILKLARWAVRIEQHYDTPMDIEWAKDGETEELFIVQARPETVQSQKQKSQFKAYTLKEKGERIVSGLAIGQAVAAGKTCIIKHADEIDRFEKGSILVTGMTDPDWVPIMKQAAGIVTDHGGRTSHAAIVSRELGVPAIVGTENATEKLENDQEITISCIEGEKGYVYAGILDYDAEEIDVGNLPKTKTEIMMNIASPAAAFRWWRLPADGIGLARMEFIINNVIKIHPMALVHFDEVKDPDARKQIEDLTKNYDEKREYFIDNLSQGIATIAASQYPAPVIVRMSDFKTNEYANLIGGQQFEPDEENPMLGFRGASRYYSAQYHDGFALECLAIKRVREQIGLDNVRIMIPFCRTLDEADKILYVLDENGLKQGQRGLEIYVMIEIPSNVMLAKEFADRFDGFSIGTNDLTQLVLGVDRDSEELKALFDERNEAVKRTLHNLLQSAHAPDIQIKVGICGQAPSDYPEFAEFLVKEGINSISLNPDSVIEIIRHVAHIEKQV